MPTPDDYRRGLVLVTTNAVAEAAGLLTGSADQVRDTLLTASPSIVAYYSDGTAALAADQYDELREAAGAPGGYRAEPVVRLREEKIRTGVLWSVEPLYRPEPDEVLAASRLAEVIQYETARPFRDTITTNTRRDPAAVGWQRVTSGQSCKFCSFLAGRGAVYRQSTARFASHPGCDCSAAPAFGDHVGPEAHVMQYVASQRTRTPAQRQRLREALAAMP